MQLNCCLKVEIQFFFICFGDNRFVRLRGKSEFSTIVVCVSHSDRGNGACLLQECAGCLEQMESLHVLTKVFCK